MSSSPAKPQKPVPFRRHAIALLLAVCTAAFGCREMQGPTHGQLAQQRKPTQGQIRFIPPSSIDDAQLVLHRCGRPLSDAVLPIYDKMNNGPVRRIVYRRRRTVIFDFTPSHPIARITGVRAPFPRPRTLPRRLPPGSVWRFDEARMGLQRMLTAKRIGFYLPCAAAALGSEY